MHFLSSWSGFLAWLWSWDEISLLWIMTNIKIFFIWITFVQIKFKEVQRGNSKLQNPNTKQKDINFFFFFQKISASLSGMKTQGWPGQHVSFAQCLYYRSRMGQPLEIKPPLYCGRCIHPLNVLLSLLLFKAFIWHLLCHLCYYSMRYCPPE